MPGEIPEISVLLCTCNPHQRTLDWVLDALAQQTLSRSRFEIIVVDNNSRVPLEAKALKKNRPVSLRVVREPKPGKSFACCTAIREADAPLMVIVDDDNGLAANYLAEALRIGAEEPRIGAFGGIANLLSDVEYPEWKKPVFRFLAVRDYGPDPITSDQPHWGHWEPIGAGMVFRREVAEAFVAFVESSAEAKLLNRQGKSYIGGEDTLLARVAYSIGYCCSYQPSLVLWHFIKRSRFTAPQLARTIRGCAEAWVINERLCGRPPAMPSRLGFARGLLSNLQTRARQEGLRASLLEVFWDLGVYRQIKASWQREPPLPHSALKSTGASS